MDINFKIPDELRNQIAKQLKQNLIDTLKRYNKVSTGQMVNSIGFNINSNGNVEVFSAPYIEFIDKGRKAGKGVPVSMLREWVKRKGLATNPQKIDQIAFAVSRKIKLRGIKPTPIFEPLFKQSLPLWDKLIDKIMDKEVQQMLDKVYKDIK